MKLVKENLSTKGFDIDYVKMSDAVEIRKLNLVIESIEAVVNELKEAGYNEQEIKSYMQVLTSDSF